MTTLTKGIAIRRIFAFFVDWFVIALWGAILFAVVMVTYAGHPPQPENPWYSQAIGFAFMTLPVVLYFTISEAGAWRATVGKRALGLRVIGVDSGRLLPVQLLLRNIIKFAPWELGHLVANQAAFSSSAGILTWVYIPMVMALGFPLWWLAALFVSGRTPYDIISSTQVVYQGNLSGDSVESKPLSEPD